MAGEGRLHKKCKELAELAGVLFRKIKFEGRKGCPDVLLIFPNGTVVFVELKNPNGDGVVSGSQSRELQKIADHNAIGYVCNSIYTFCQILDEHEPCEPPVFDVMLMAACAVLDKSNNFNQYEDDNEYELATVACAALAIYRKHIGST